LRKSFLVAGVATLSLGITSVAMAQNPAPVLDATATVSPSKAGTKSKPKSEKFKLVVKNNEESKATASKITVTFPSTLKMSTSGLTTCKASDDDLLADIDTCKSSIAGTGEAHALVNPFAPNRAELEFKVTPIVGNKEILFVLDSNIADAVLHGKIKGRKMTIEIPKFLQMPAPNTYSALLDLTTTLSKKKGSKALISSNGCKSKKHKVGVKVDFVGNPSPPAANSASDTAEAKCS
jgi:hypothetical protein